MNAFDYKFFEEFLREQSGLMITPEKIYLLETRLSPIAAANGFRGLNDLAAALRHERNDEIERQVVEAMTTNETSFFRDVTPFQKLRDHVLPHFIETRGQQRHLRVWSAACSTGQEPYSLAMLLKEYPPLAGWRVDIIASDISMGVLASAQMGLYSQLEVQRGLPIQMLVKYFTQEGQKWRLKREMRDMVSFRPGNLLSPPPFGLFDIIFCRNVLMYFAMPDRVRALEAVHATTRQDTVMFVGAPEIVAPVTDLFRPLSEVQGIFVRGDTTFTTKNAAV